MFMTLPCLLVMRWGRAMTMTMTMTMTRFAARPDALKHQAREDACKLGTRKRTRTRTIYSKQTQ